MDNKKCIIKGVIATVAVVVVFLVWLLTINFNAIGYQVASINIKECISSFILTEGVFPVSQQELEDKKYLRKHSSDKEFYEVFIIPINEDEKNIHLEHKYQRWQPVWMFDRFQLAYGIQLDDLKVENGIVKNIKTGEQILLIKGPYMFPLRGHYERLSLGLYNLMFRDATTDEVRHLKGESDDLVKYKI